MSQPGTSQTGWHLKADQHSLPGKMYSISAINAFAKKQFPLAQQTVFGRDPSCCDVTLPGSHISRRHAELTLAEDHLIVRDLGSANGTYINGVKVTEGLARSGDEIRFDTITLKVVSPESEIDNTVVHPRSRPFVEDTVMRSVSRTQSIENEDEIVDVRGPLIDRILPKEMDAKTGAIIGLIIIAVSAIVIAVAK